MSRHAAEPERPTTGSMSLAALALTATGAGLVATAAPAEAETNTDWSAIAQCESSGNWSANTGNGFFGGLQFTQSTWDEFGGRSYAAHPQDASEASQVAIAENVLSVQGYGAWPVCGAHAHDGSATVHSTAPATSHRTSPSPTPSPYRPLRRTSAAAPHRAGRYVVARGDTLSGIAGAYGTTWQHLAVLNPHIANPDMIYVGDHVIVPTG